MEYKERNIGKAYVYEQLEQGWFRVISEDGRNDLLKGFNMSNANVGDIGNLIYYTDKSSYGLTKFVPDNSVDIDFDLLVKNYNSKWNANISITR